MNEFKYKLSEIDKNISLLENKTKNITKGNFNTLQETEKLLKKTIDYLISQNNQNNISEINMNKYFKDISSRKIRIKKIYETYKNNFPRYDNFDIIKEEGNEEENDDDEEKQFLNNRNTTVKYPEIENMMALNEKLLSTGIKKLNEAEDTIIKTRKLIKQDANNYADIDQESRNIGSKLKESEIIINSISGNEMCQKMFLYLINILLAIIIVLLLIYKLTSN